MDEKGENNGKAYFLMDDLGGKPIIFGITHIYLPNWLIFMVNVGNLYQFPWISWMLWAMKWP